jgi:glutathione S-transferase
MKLYIAHKNYSSWSLRGWLCAKLSGVAFEEVMVPLTGQVPNPAYFAFAPNGLVPCLHDGDVVVWESLAIAEYLAERNPRMWPADAKARAHARSIASEMHAGFRSLRNDMTMCIRERLDVRPWSDATAADIERVCALWTEARQRFGGAGDYLFGDFSIADCFFAPVAFRFRTYLVEPQGEARAYWQRLLAHPFLREWEHAALADASIIAADEPRIVYREKLRAAGQA